MTFNPLFLIAMAILIVSTESLLVARAITHGHDRFCVVEARP